MDCRQARPLMTQMLDGTLDPAQEEPLHQHLDDCPDCQCEYWEWTHLANHLERLPNHQPPKNFDQRVMARIHFDEKPRKSRSGVVLIWLGLAGWIGLLVVEAVSWMGRMAGAWIRDTAVLKVLDTLSELVLVERAFYLLVPVKGWLDWMNWASVSNAWWAGLALWNLTLLLVLIKISLDRLLDSGRGGLG